MPILEEQKNKFFQLLDFILKKGSEEFTELEDMKTEGGVQYPKEAFLYVPDAAKPSTWKLRIWETPEAKVTRRQLGRAAAAFSSGGFRGQKVELPSEDVGKVKAKLVSLYKKDGASKEEIPNYLLEEGGEDNMPEEKRMDDMDKKLQELSDTFAKDKVAMEESYKASISAMEKKLSETYAKEMEATNKKLAEAEKVLAEREKDLHTEKVKNTCSALVEKGFWPAVVAKVEKVMLSDTDGKFSTIKLDDKTDMSISEVLVDILETIPTEVRVNLEELSHKKKNEDPNHKFMSEKEVEEYAKTNKLSYQEACSVLTKEGKIEL
jgi:hypothetical protein